MIHCYNCGKVDTLDRTTLNLWGYWMDPPPLWDEQYYDIHCMSCGAHSALKANDLTDIERVWAALLVMGT